MDIREIQALHAKYAAQPVVIDINGHVEAMPALPAPEGNRRRIALPRLGRLKRLVRPIAIAVVAAALAAGGGVSAAKLWRALRAPSHAELTPQATTPAPLPAPAAASALTSTHPLTAADFAGSASAPTGTLASVDSRSLTALQDPPSANPSPREPAAPSDLNKAATAPIRAPRTAESAAASATTEPAPPPAAPPKAAPRHIRRSTARPHAAPAENTEPATPAPAAKAPAAKSGDVQLF
ncbi:MAG: hypothetical protein ACN6QT_06130 [Burkholderia contaminans]|uniref:Uncharacterized protein n=1 Tax=Burkholderia aenigmatica TaxID=2015348 RepID=A0A228HP31_9BURK|nr:MULTISPECIES: hypothetical protein [Burkholderia cepacia complex]MBR8009173.1 hypothetical protein [Burkholderia vietnamiensis]MBR8151528.1 hypothetical protein [Burkholderia vietnamiensis]MBR8164660.1 hypothetical protein [Burkholderia vietnamiensis]MBR8193020.1 hypothetical protein [Burkholderia vietnamiensis]MCA8291522.1 hypothetical protein [Burkholderia vietnamiensis]